MPRGGSRLSGVVCRLDDDNDSNFNNFGTTSWIVILLVLNIFKELIMEIGTKENSLIIVNVINYLINLFNSYIRCPLDRCTLSVKVL